MLLACCSCLYHTVQQEVPSQNSKGRLHVQQEVPAHLLWLHSELPDPCFVAVHAETQVASGVWKSITQSFQPFKTTVDATSRGVYWHKDMPQSFYGEVWNYDETHISLRQESFPKFPPPFDPTSASWDVRPDKFRLFSSDMDTNSQLPGGLGRVLAPVHFSSNWTHSGNMTTHLCRNWLQFSIGNCSLYQPHFLDLLVSVREIGGLNTAFDGALDDDPGGQFAVDSTMHNLRDARVIDQRMAGSSGGPASGRERFFFARAPNGTNLGIVRWDSSVANSSAPDGFTVQQRTLGCTVKCHGDFNSSGFRSRRLHDTATVSQ